jgi:hypothetical protein
MASPVASDKIIVEGSMAVNLLSLGASIRSVTGYSTLAGMVMKA